MLYFYNSLLKKYEFDFSAMMDHPAWNCPALKIKLVEWHTHSDNGEVKCETHYFMRGALQQLQYVPQPSGW